jgi:hypothetical protein
MLQRNTIWRYAMWDVWKKGFYAWEGSAAKFAEELARSPLLLGPSGKALSIVMRVKAANDTAAAAWLGAIGLPTKRDQERTLHALNQLQSQLYDLEEKIEELGGI